jgi:rod shape-determining protein MreC
VSGPDRKLHGSFVLGTRPRPVWIRYLARRAERTQTLGLVLIFIVGGLALLVLGQTGILGPAQGAIGKVTTPIQRQVSQLFRGTTDFTRNFEEVESLRLENEKLREAVHLLSSERASLLEVAHENEILREQLGILGKYPELKGIAGQVIARPPANSDQYVVIDKGSDDGVEVGMAVLSAAGLVGQITEAEASRSKALLLVDINSSVNAVVQSSRADGVVQGQFQLGGPLVMKFIPQEETIQEGAWVVTSGLGGLFPKGLLIGTVSAVHSSDVETMQDAEVIPACDFGRLQGVIIVVGER